MKHSLQRIFIFLIIISLVLVGCTKDPATVEIREKVEGKADVIKVFVSFYPYYDFAQKVGGDNVQISTIVPAGTEPHSFEPSPKTIAKLEKADIFIYNGLDMEPWLDKVLTLLEGKDIKLIDASKTVEVIYYDEEDHTGHNHEEEDHNHGQYDPHIWVDPINVINISQAIKEAFIDIDSANKDVYESNYSSFKGDLEELDNAFIEGLKDAEERKIIVSHSAFGYLAKRYNIEEIAIAGISPNAEPNPKRLAELTEIARRNKINYVFFEALANVKTAEILADEAGLDILTLYNVEGLTDDQRNNGDDYISIMYDNLDTLKKALVK